MTFDWLSTNEITYKPKDLTPVNARNFFQQKAAENASG